MDKKLKYIFGPVPSRRLGKSLGVDIVPFKTCSYDCIYCQLGRTTNKTIEREDFVPAEKVLEELKSKLNEGIEIDYITFSGSGEPTLNLKIGHLISEIKTITNIPVAVLTNGSLLFDEEVQNSLIKADLVIPNLDAANELVFKYISRPHPDLNFARIIDGLINFRERFTGRLWLEIFLLAGINTEEKEILGIKALIDKIKPDGVQLNTSVRPTAEDYARPVSKAGLEQIAQLISQAEVIAYPEEESLAWPKRISSEADILALLKRRPCTRQEVASSLGLCRIELSKHLAALKQKGLIKEIYQDGRTYFVV